LLKKFFRIRSMELKETCRPRSTQRIFLNESVQWNWKLETLFRKKVLTKMCESVQWNWKPSSLSPSTSKNPRESVQWNWKMKISSRKASFASGSLNPFNGIERWRYTSTPSPL